MAKRSCTEDGCTNPHHAKGWCGEHYQTWRRWGDPLAPKVRLPYPLNLTERLERQPDGCLYWTGAPSSDGYGVIRTPDGYKGVHVVAYMAEHGPIPEGYQVDHTCHNDSGCDLGTGCLHRVCVEPSHLEAVPQRENIMRGEGLAAINARKTHCPKGHPLSGANLYIYPHRVGRGCRICMKEKARLGYLARKEAARA